MRLVQRFFPFLLIAGVIVGSVPAPAVGQPDVLSHYTFDDGPSNGSSYSDGDVVPDDGPNGHDLAVVGSGLTWTSNGQVGGAVSFDGVDGFLEDADAEGYLNGLDALTVVVWVRSNTTGTNNGILTSEPPDNDDQNLSLRHDADGDFGGATNVIKGGINTEGGKQEYESAADVQTTDWQFLALVYEDGEPLRLYVDGQFSTPSYNPQNASGLTTGAETLRIGQGAKETGDIWDGEIDDLRIYDAVVSEDDLDQIYDDTLPVELSQFDVRAEGSTAFLQWTTASESNNAGFHVEHQAPDDHAWARTTFVNGAGTTSQPQTYRLETQRLAQGTHRFRLVQVDHDGTTVAHAPASISIRPEDADALQVGPNPTQGQTLVTVHSPIEGPLTVELYNVLGERVRVLYDGTVSANSGHRLTVSTSSLSSGTYFVRADGPAGTWTEALSVMK